MVMNITSVFKIHDTVLQVSYEAQTLLPEMPVIRSENKLLSELVLCILSSQEKYEVALAMMKSLRKENILRIPKNKSEFSEIKSEIKTTLKNPVSFKSNEKEYSRRLRFFVKKAEYIIDTLENIYLNNLTIKEILKQKNCIQETRKNIINYSCGLGPKQASMFLRNIGYYSEFAVLDKHVIDYMRIMGLTCVGDNNFSNISAYQKIETKLKSYAETYNVNLLHLDLAIWTTMRALKTYHG
jgi:N-glycosylase/DNA lyase